MALSDNSDDLIISISTDLATVKRSLNKLVSDVGQASSGIEKQFAATGKAINASMSTSMQKQIDQMVGVGTKGAKEWNGVLADQGKELERLRAQYSPLFATISSYKKSIEDIRRAHAVGAISADEMAAAISRERQASLASIAAIKARQSALSATKVQVDPTQTADYAAELERLRGKFDPLYAAMQRHKSALAEIAKAEQMGAISASQATSARTAETASYNAQVGKLNDLAAAKKRAAENVGAGKDSSLDRSADIAAYGKELDALRAKFNPVFAVISQYKANIAEIRQAGAVGAIGIEEMTAALSRERQAALNSIAAIKGRNTAIAETAKSSKSGNSSHYTSNIAAQFQDIGVTAAGGMSPLQIALQQGTQLSAVFNDMKSNGQSAGSALAGAFASIVSPVSLVTIGLVAASAAAIQYFSGLLSKDEEAAKVLKEQAQLISAVAERWGETIPALREYADQLRRAQEGVDLRDGVKIINENTLVSVKKQIADASVGMADLVTQLQSAGEEAEVIKRLQQAFGDFTKAANEGKLETADVERVQTALADAINSSGIPAVSAFAAMFKDLSGAALTAAGSVQSANDAAARSSDITTWRSYNKDTRKLGLDDQTNDGPIQGLEFSTPEDGPMPTSRPLIELEGTPWIPKAKAVSAPKKTAEDRFTADMQAMSDRTAALKQEIELVGQSNEEQVKRRAALDLEQKALADLREEARKNGEKDLESITLSQDKIKAINSEAAAYAAQVQVLHDVQEAQQNAENAAREFYDTAKSGFADVVTGAESLSDALSNLVKKLGDLALNSAFDSLFKGATGSGGWLTNLFGGGSTDLSKYTGMTGLFADGGYTGAGGKYEPAGVVHKGEYVFDADSVRKAGGPAGLDAMRRRLKGYANGGYVGPRVPHIPDVSSMAASKSSTMQISINPVIDNRGASVEAVARQEQAMNNLQKTLPTQIINAIRDARARGVKV